MNAPLPSPSLIAVSPSLIPDQRPAQHGAPEDPDISRAVAGDRPESAAPGEELVGRLDQTELVAVGIGENDVLVVGTLADIDVPSAEIEEVFDRLGLVVERCGRQVEVDRVLGLLRHRHCAKDEVESGVVGRHQGDLVARRALDLPTQRFLPEPCETRRVVGVDGKGDESGGHRHIVPLRSSRWTTSFA
jgi:hypothetical protein